MRALVTGASSGIGRSIALELARRGWSLALVGRDAAALRDVRGQCAELAPKPGGSPKPVSYEIFAADLTDPDQTDRLLREVEARGLEIDALVNNAGFAVHGPFAETDLRKELDLVTLQISAALRLTKALLPGMRARRRGWVLNVGSVYSLCPVPEQAVYGACKSFLLSYSEALAHELRGSGVSVTLLCPGSTRTEFRKRGAIHEARPGSGMDPDRVARDGVDAMLKGTALHTPGLQNRIFTLISRMLIGRKRSSLVAMINRRRGLLTHAGTDR